ncbi:hypothetical protein DFH11DRAFT_1582288, partial [Phellopilus nigrolimitatus]
MIRTSSMSRLVRIILSRSRVRGRVLSWGFSCFSQLGYAVDGFGAGLAGMPQMVATLRRVVGPLKKELVIGVAACKTASACWTAKELFTWGSN